MLLKVILPHQVLLEQDRVKRIVVETKQGSFGLLPRRLDCVIPLAYGILLYETEQGEQYAAVGNGLLAKTGRQVVVAVNKAVCSGELQKLRQLLQAQFLKEDEQEKNIRLALTKLESAFIRHFLELKRHG